MSTKLVREIMLSRARVLFYQWLDGSFNTIVVGNGSGRTVNTLDTRYILLVTTPGSSGATLTIKVRECVDPHWITKLQVDYLAFDQTWRIYAHHLVDVTTITEWHTTTTAKYVQLEPHIIQQITLIGLAWSDMRDEVFNEHN